MTEAIKQSLTLKSGYEMPVLGLGTWQLTGKACEETVRRAVDLGYRHIDTAELYENEAEIGRALLGLERDKLFITSKVATSHLKGDEVHKACDRSLAKLGTEYLDLYLIHWPNDNIPIAETLEAMQQLVEKGKVRAVGLSNFDKGRIQKVLSESQVPISNLQIEYHPFTPREELPEYCREEGITITAYSPLARGIVFEEPAIKQIAEKHNKTAAQVSLRWLVQKGHIVIPKASSEEHLQANKDIFDWELAPEEMDDMDNIQNEQRLIDTTYT